MVGQTNQFYDDKKLPSGTFIKGGEKFMKKLLIVVSLFLIPTFAHAASGCTGVGCSQSITISATLTVWSAISITAGNSMIFPTLIAGQALNSTISSGTSQVTTGQNGQNASFTVNGQTGGYFQVANPATVSWTAIGAGCQLVLSSNATSNTTIGSTVTISGTISSCSPNTATAGGYNTTFSATAIYQ
jgi:hypothetical protein